jgi:hypothetical protein
MRTVTKRTVFVATLVAALGAAPDAAAQLDPLIYLKRTKPNVLLAVDTSARMQRDTNNDYRDPNVYKKLGGASLWWEAALKISAANTLTTYRRKYVGLTHTDLSSLVNRFSADHIEIVGDLQAEYGSFDEHARLSIARRALLEAVARNSGVARFGLLKLRQNNPRYDLPASVGATLYKINDGTVSITSSDWAWVGQKFNGDSAAGKWKITRSIVSSTNASIAGPVAPVVAADSAGAAAAIGPAITALLPAGRDSEGVVDAPLDNLLDDVKAEASRLIAADTECRNTVVVLVAGGGEGTPSLENPVAKAATFLSIGGHRVPIYVIAIAPLSVAERIQLQGIATASGGQYTEITAAMAAAAVPTVPLPELVRAVNVAVSHAFATQADFDRAPDATHPYGYGTEHQVTSPLVGTVDLEGGVDMAGKALPKSVIYHAVSGVKVPQRANVLVTAGYSLPAFEGRLRAFRMYRPEADPSKPSGYRFVADGTKLWVAAAPPAGQRNIYTALPNGAVVAFTSANAATLQPYLRTSDAAKAAALIDFIRAQPLGAIVGSTPAIMDPPSLDPPPDASYPAFADANKGRRAIVWVGASDGMLHAIDARLGREVWAFVPFNLLPKLGALRSGQPVGDFRYFVDGSPKIADVKVGGTWRTYLVVGEGPGGTFYQTFDVTLDDIDNTVSPTSNDLADVLEYFSSASSVPLKWAFPRYADFDVSLGAWGDLAATAPADAKSVGQTWSAPAIGQIESAAGRYAVLTGSGFLPWSVQQQANRGGAVAGNTFYLLDAATGAVLDRKSVGNDGKAEDVDDCAAVNDCRKLKNALQADPVATGPFDSRFITRAYVGDLDGRIWRFDIGLDGAGVPRINTLVGLYTVDTGSGSASDHPIFSSMATVNLGGVQQYLFVGTGSDLLPRNKVSVKYALLAVLDNGPSGSKTAMIELEKTDLSGSDEQVSSFPAAAGDIVFFSTTTYKAAACSLPDANLYAMTFIGGPAYDTTGDGKVSTGGKGASDSTKIRTTIGTRGTAPFISDQHLVFGTGTKVELFGDPEDFNNGVGQVGVRILSWRESR